MWLHLLFALILSSSSSFSFSLYAALHDQRETKWLYVLQQWVVWKLSSYLSHSLLLSSTSAIQINYKYIFQWMNEQRPDKILHLVSNGKIRYLSFSLYFSPFFILFVSCKFIVFKQFYWYTFSESILAKVCIPNDIYVLSPFIQYFHFIQFNINWFFTKFYIFFFILFKILFLFSENFRSKTNKKTWQIKMKLKSRR